jgi:hypothetical protein
VNESVSVKHYIVTRCARWRGLSEDFSARPQAVLVTCPVGTSATSKFPKEIIQFHRKWSGDGRSSEAQTTPLTVTLERNLPE